MCSISWCNCLMSSLIFTSCYNVLSSFTSIICLHNSRTQCIFCWRKFMFTKFKSFAIFWIHETLWSRIYLFLKHFFLLRFYKSPKKTFGAYYNEVTKRKTVLKIGKKCDYMIIYHCKTMTQGLDWIGMLYFVLTKS